MTSAMIYPTSLRRGCALWSRLLLGFALAITAAGRPPLSAQEWTRFRGPNGSGLGDAPGLPAAFSANDFRWNVELPGTGHSSPVIWGERVFVTATPKNSTKRLILCLRAEDGGVIWKREYETAGYHLHADNSYSAASPTVDSERVYVHWASPEESGLVALDQRDGRELWRKELGPFVSPHGPGTSPIVYGESVLLHFDHEASESFLLCMDAKTGAERWKFVHAGTSSTASTPCIYEGKGMAPQVILTTRTLGMLAVDARTGAQVWDLPRLMPKRCIASPLVTPQGLLIGQCGEGRAESFVYAVRPGGAGHSPEKLYEVVRVGGYVPTPLAVEDYLFLWKENGWVTCLRASDREQLWSERVEGPYYGSPVCVNGCLYNMTVRGDLVVLKANGRFEQVARIALGEGSHATPAVSGGRMYLRTLSRLICVGGR